MMRKKIIPVMWGVLFLMVFLLAMQLYDYWQKNVHEEIHTEETRELTILSTYEEPYIRSTLTHITENYVKQNPELKVTLQFVNSADFQKKICLLKDAKNLPELIICDNVMTPALVSMGIYQDISDRIGEKKADQYIQAAFNTGLINGKNYALPFAADAYVLYYNKSFFEKNNFDEPKSLTELQNMLNSVHTLGNYNFAMACKNEEDITGAFLQMVYLFGGNILDLDGKGSLQFYSMLENFRDNNVFPKDMVNWNQQDLMKAFSEEMVMTAVAKLSSLPLLKQNKRNFEYGIMEIPYEHNQAYLLHGENIGITVDVNDKEVWDLLEYMTGKEAVQILADETGKFPVRIDGEYSMLQEEGMDEHFVQRERSQSMGKKSYSTWFLISSAISEQLLDFFTTSIDAETAAHNMQESVREAILER